MLLLQKQQIKVEQLTTMEHALEHGKEIFAVPGSYHIRHYQKVRISLLIEGAKPVWNGYQILEELNDFEQIATLEN